MCLWFVFLMITRTVSWLRLSRRTETWKTAEILLLRHQLAVLQRRQPRRPNLSGADRALPVTLLDMNPQARRRGLRLLVTPDTIVRWHRDLIRRRWAARSVQGKTGRPATRRNIQALVLRLARENPGFLRSQAEAILACDFFTADLLDGTQAYVLAVIEHATRRIRILGFTLHPTGEWRPNHLRGILRQYETHHNQHRPHRSLHSAAPLNLYLNRSFSSSTGHEGALASVALSMNIAWSRDLDEIVGTHTAPGRAPRL